MWFAPAATPHEEGVAGSITGLPSRPRSTPSHEMVLVKLLGAPIRALAEFESHYRELRREVRLLALAHEDKYPLAKSLAELFGSLQREVQDGLDAEQLRRARQAGTGRRRHRRARLARAGADDGPLRGAARLSPTSSAASSTCWP